MGFLDTISKFTSAVSPVVPFISSVTSGFGERLANKQTAKYASDMSNTAYQRAMADMKKAGLNPILAGKLGGASTPNVQFGNIGAAATTAYQQASQANQSQSQSNLIDTEQGIKQRTLDYLNKENLTMEQIQYTASNVFSSKVLDTFEKALAGRTNELEDPYRALGNYIQQFLKQTGASKANLNTKGQFKLDLTGQKLGQLIAGVGIEAKNLGVQAFGELGMEIFESLIGVK
jgi:hypothetical protein